MHHSASSPTAPSLSPELARSLALEAGFAQAGVVALPHSEEPRDASRFEDWVRAGRAGTMRYLERAAEDGQLARSRVGAIFPWAQSALVCFALYDSAKPRSTAPADRGMGWIARYAWTSRASAEGARPSDYHKVLLKRLKALEAQLHAQLGEFEARAYVDTGPVVERALATAAGLGWTGKNTCLIHPKLGSFGFLAVLLTSLPVQLPDPPQDPPPVQPPAQQQKLLTLPIPDRCGSCRRCIDACPTGALIAPYQMDATRCIAYLTIEHKGTIAQDLMQGMGRQVFGCDICQDVCPWNRKSPVAIDPDLAARPELVNPPLDWLAAMDEAEFEARFNGSPVRRAGFKGLRRNVAIAMGNSGLDRFGERLEAWAADADEGLRTAAQWALARLTSRETASKWLASKRSGSGESQSH